MRFASSASTSLFLLLLLHCGPLPLLFSNHHLQAHHPGCHALLDDVYSSDRFHRTQGKAIDRSYLVRFKNLGFLKNRTAVIEAAARYIAENEGAIRHYLSELIAGFSFQFNSSLAESVVEANLWELLNATNIVDYIEQDAEISSWANVNCPGSWGLDRIDQRALPLDGVFHYDLDGTGVDAYVLDTGVRSTHEQFEGRVTCGESFILFEPDSCNDLNGHGTHVSGTIGGKDYGVARNVSIIAVKVLNGSGKGSTSGIVAAIEWVADQVRKSGKNSVINMSLGGEGSSSSTDDAILEAGLAGTLTVVAAGNDAGNACLYTPSGSEYAVTVASTDINDARSSYSNYGDCVSIFAPGRDITSAWSSSDTATRTISGTSMASPHIAGLAAVYWQEVPNLSVLELAQKIRNSSSPDQVTNSLSRWDEIGVTVATFSTQVTENPNSCKYAAAVHHGGTSLSIWTTVLSTVLWMWAFSGGSM